MFHVSKHPHLAVLFLHGNSEVNGSVTQGLAAPSTKYEKDITINNDSCFINVNVLLERMLLLDEILCYLKLICKLLKKLGHL